MKTHSLRRAVVAFTLIELLTVIAIIAILMGLLFPVIASSINQTKRADANIAVKSIVTGCQQYLNDYGKFPEVPSAMATDFMSFGDMNTGGCKEHNDKLFDVLRNINRSGPGAHPLNPRQKPYMDTKAATDTQHPRGGFVDGSQFPPAEQGRFMDPWGKEYCVILETDGDGQIDMSTFFTNLSGPTDIVRKSAVAFSMAKDGVRGTPAQLNQISKDKDDLVSW